MRSALKHYSQGWCRRPKSNEMKYNKITLVFMIIGMKLLYTKRKNLKTTTRKL